MTERGWDVVVVGAGTAGCAVAARLADAGRRVLVLEAGADHVDVASTPAELLDPTTMRATAPEHPANWNLRGELTPERTVAVPRGRVSGGSSALNAAVFLRATPADFDGWAAAGNPLWSYQQVLPALCRLEADQEFGDRPGHGAGGPVPVERAPAQPLGEAFAAAAIALGFPEEADKNAGAAPGVGPVPLSVSGGIRMNTALAYLGPRRGLPGLVVRGGTTVHRVLVRDGRAVGVLTAEGEIHADEVLLCAGAVGSPLLLLRSGLGPADELRSHGLPVVVDLPGVGADLSDHPQVHVPFRAVPGLPRPGLPLSVVLHATSSSAGLPGDLELQPWSHSFARVTGDPDTPADLLTVGVGLQRADSRGRLSLTGPGAQHPPRLEYRYLSGAADRRRLREGVRLTAELLRAAATAGLVAERADPGDDVLADDVALDGWVMARLGTAVHLSGTARMGPDGDPGAVVDQHLRVRGVAGLRVVDTAALPSVPSRGSAATAVLIGERAAELILG